MAASQNVYRKLYSRLWRHRGFLTLTDRARLLSLYLLTGPQTNSIGCYPLSVALAAEDLSTTPKAIKHDLKLVCEAFGWEHDAEERLLWIPSWPKWNPRTSPNQGKTWRNEIQALPECKAKACLTLAIDLPTASQPLAVAIQKQKQNTEAETEAEVVRTPATQPVATRMDSIHGRRNKDLMTYGPVPLWASQFRDEIIPLVAMHFAGDRGAADGPARAWIGELDDQNMLGVTDAVLAAPVKWWRGKARERWALSELAVSANDTCPRCGSPEGLCADIKVCNRRWLDSQQNAQQEA